MLKAKVNYFIVIVLMCVCAWNITVVQAVLLADNLPSTQYLEVKQDTEIFSRIGDRVISVGEVKKGELLEVNAEDDDGDYQFKFGYGIGFIDRDALRPISKTRKAIDTLGELNKPLTNQNLITHRPVVVYGKMGEKARVIAVLEGNLRYPIIAKLTGDASQTWYEINLGGQLGFIRASDTELDTGIPVLTYHHILLDEENKRFQHTSTTTSLEAFKNQMAYLDEEGYQTISLYQLEGYLFNRINLPAKVVVLTFDDGLKSVSRYAYPVLKQYGFEATAFIISSRIKRYPQKWNPDTLQFMSISEIEDVQDVFDIQSHTHFLHRYAGVHQPILLVRSYHNILFDFEHARRALAEFNPHVQYLSYPFGGYDQKAIDAARDSGYHLAVTTVQGKVKPGDNPFTLKRLYILRTDSIQTMADRLANGDQPKYQSVGE